MFTYVHVYQCLFAKIASNCITESLLYLALLTCHLFIIKKKSRKQKIKLFDCLNGLGITQCNFYILIIILVLIRNVVPLGSEAL